MIAITQTLFAPGCYFWHLNISKIFTKFFTRSSLLMWLSSRSFIEWNSLLSSPVTKINWNIVNNFFFIFSCLKPVPVHFIDDLIFDRVVEGKVLYLCGRQVTVVVFTITVTVTDILIVYTRCLWAAPLRKEMCPGESN